MKRILLALSALAIGTAAASAADMAPRYTKAPPAPPPPPCIWCGFYIGLNGGWAGNTGSNDNNLAVTTIEDSVASPVFFAPLSNNQNTNGWFGGGQIGYNWVFPGGMGGAGYGGASGWLVGVEADIQGASLHRSSPTLVFFNDVNPNTVTTDSRLNWFGTLRGRFGWATGPVLFYGTGGLAFGGVKNNLLVSTSDNDGDCTTGPGGNSLACSVTTLSSHTDNRWGWVAGVGIEWMFAPNWSVKGEYQYIDLGSVTHTAAAIVTETSPETEGIIATGRVNERFNTVRIGVNYHFGGPALGGY
jgi:outer membrane immunogenic protein